MPDARYGNLLIGGWRDLSYEHFRDGVLVHWVVKGGQGEPTVAVLKYEPGASVPLHRHAGLETIMVLDGSNMMKMARMRLEHWYSMPWVPSILFAQRKDVRS